MNSKPKRCLRSVASATIALATLGWTLGGQCNTYEDCLSDPQLKQLPALCDDFKDNNPFESEPKTGRRSWKVDDHHIVISWQRKGIITTYEPTNGIEWDSIRKPKLDVVHLSNDLLVGVFHLSFASGNSDINPAARALITQFIQILNHRLDKLESLRIVAHTDIQPPKEKAWFDNRGICANKQSIYDGGPISPRADECLGWTRVDAFLAYLSEHSLELKKSRLIHGEYSPSFFLELVDNELGGRLIHALQLQNRITELRKRLGLGAYDPNSLEQVKQIRLDKKLDSMAFSDDLVADLEPFRSIVAIARFRPAEN